jgi:3-methylfumaryl-CoA hydratase
MNDVAAWIGRCETVADFVAADRIAGLMALLDDPGPLPGTLPPLGHWLLARPAAIQSAIGEDGHPERGGDAVLPPIALPRRMWAASDIAFLADIPLGAAIERRTTVVAIDPKQGKSGAMIFVTLDHEIVHDGKVAIRERQHIVYRDAPAAAVAVPPGEPAPAAEASRSYTADPVALFRYSALTFNAHRIHYDRDYARTEGYPGLVVHGPFAATLLLDHYRRSHPGRRIARFAFRARAPLFDGCPFTLAFTAERLWIADAAGAIAMTAEVG